MPDRTRRNWSRRFDAPIVLPDGKKLVTLRDAIQYLDEAVSKREREHPEVQAAAALLTNCAEGRDFMMHAQIATILALYRNERR